VDPLISSDEDSSLPSHSHSQPLLPSDRDDEDAADEGQFAFRRNRNSTYLPVSCLFHLFAFFSEDINSILFVIEIMQVQFFKFYNAKNIEICTASF
jgi:hypothetical protein